MQVTVESKDSWKERVLYYHKEGREARTEGASFFPEMGDNQKRGAVFQWPLCTTQHLDEAFIVEYKKRHWPMILVLGRLRQEDLSFKASLGYTVRSCLKEKQGWCWLGSLPDWESRVNAAATSLRRPARTIGLGECKRQTPNQSLQSRAPDPMWKRCTLQTPTSFGDLESLLV